MVSFFLFLLCVSFSSQKFLATFLSFLSIPFFLVTDMDSFDNAPPNVMLALGPPEQQRHHHQRPSPTGTPTSSSPTIPTSSNNNHPLVTNNNNNNDGGNDEQQKTRWTCHKKVLSEHSPYFAAMFDGEFSESGASIVFLPPGVFTAIGLDGVLHYMYTNELVLNVNGSINEAHAKIQQLQDMYSAGDYLGMAQLRQTVGERLSESAHQWTCYCTECRDAVTQLFPYSYARAVHFEDEIMAVITEKILVLLTQEPDKTLQSYWTSRGLAEMLALTQPDVGPYLKQQIIGRISRFNAIETLYACFMANKSFEQQKNKSSSTATSSPSSSSTTTTPGDHNGVFDQLKSTVAAAQSRSTEIIVHFFDFYCSQYPTLLSCIDGITYSFDFLEFLLQRTLADNMKPDNAPIIYQGIVRDLMCRHAVQHCSQVKLILTDAKSTVLKYIVGHFDLVTKSNAFDRLDKNVLTKLAEDTMMHPRVFENSTTTTTTSTNAAHQARRYSGASASIRRSSTVEFRGSSANHTPSSSEDTGQLRKFFYWFTSITKISSSSSQQQQYQQKQQQQQHFIASKKSKLVVTTMDSSIHQGVATSTTAATTDTTDNNNDNKARRNKIMRGLRSPIGKRRILLVRRPLTSP
ncbi:hypothetical protein BDA99DRAFT_500243 [Phascolomyces articulosus]|uniref:BTB domain-containing protein n=1 Tax=Phascolomyces articulosus TaxID=60185 RepID=A0AAD5PGX3_9FUNG|nr:hypothetical protein BDA99DRAFT_500243 [Phascolomyces articulosus]